MKKAILLIVATLVLASTLSTTLAQTTNIVVTDVTPPTPPVVTVHHVMVPASISATLAPTLLAQLDPQHPAGKVVKQLVIVGSPNGSFTATITYVNAP